MTNTKAMTDEQNDSDSLALRAATEIMALNDLPVMPTYQLKAKVQCIVAEAMIKFLQAALSAPMTTDNAKLIEAVAQCLRNIRAAQLPDPYDERDVSKHWLIKKMNTELGILDQALSDYHAQSKEQ